MIIWLVMRMLLFVCLMGVSCIGAPKPVVLDPSYQHDRFNTEPDDQIREFRAYTVSFDGADDNNQYGEPEAFLKACRV